MSRTIREVNLSTRAARDRLKPSGKPYYRSLDQGLHLGYRRGLRGAAWVMRWYVGAEAYTTDEARRLLNTCDEDFRKIVEAALLTGARYGELAAMIVSDFNPDSGTVHIRTSKAGKARHVVLNDEGRALFERLTTGRAGDHLIFTKADGTMWGKSHQHRRLKAASERAKILPALDFHSLRHSWASLTIMAGAPLLVVAQNLGHADTRMVERHYGHLAHSFVAETIRGPPRRSVRAAPTTWYRSHRLDSRQFGQIRPDRH